MPWVLTLIIGTLEAAFGTIFTIVITRAFRRHDARIAAKEAADRQRAEEAARLQREREEREEERLERIEKTLNRHTRSLSALSRASRTTLSTVASHGEDLEELEDVTDQLQTAVSVNRERIRRSEELIRELREQRQGRAANAYGPGTTSRTDPAGS